MFVRVRETQPVRPAADTVTRTRTRTSYEHEHVYEREHDEEQGAADYSRSITFFIGEPLRMNARIRRFMVRWVALR